MFNSGDANLYNSFEDGDWSIFEDQYPAKKYVKNQIIYHQGDTSDCFYYLKSGKVSVFLTSENGVEKVLATPGGSKKGGRIIGEASFFDRMPRISSARALTDSYLIPIGQARLLEQFRLHPELAIDMLCDLSKRVLLLSAQVNEMTFLQADKRIAHLLIADCGEMDREKIVLHSHEEIGNLAGCSRVTVSKILGSFAKKGWVEIQYRSIEITDYPALQSFAISE